MRKNILDLLKTVVALSGNWFDFGVLFKEACVGAKNLWWAARPVQLMVFLQFFSTGKAFIYNLGCCVWISRCRCIISWSVYILLCDEARLKYRLTCIEVQRNTQIQIWLSVAVSYCMKCTYSIHFFFQLLASFNIPWKCWAFLFWMKKSEEIRFTANTGSTCKLIHWMTLIIILMLYKHLPNGLQCI